MGLMKVSEIARITGLSERSVHRLIERGKLVAIKIGGATRIREEDLRAFVDSAPARTPRGGSR